MTHPRNGNCQWTGTSIGQAGVATAQKETPDVILCDVTMPKLDGFGVLAALRREPTTATVPFIFLTARGERPDVRAGMNLGADDYLTKPASAEEVIAAVEARLIRHSTLQTANGGPDFRSATPLEALGLTPREAEVLLWVAQGKSNGEVGTILNISDNTAKAHLSRIYQKLGVETRTAAAMVAMETLARRGADPVR